MDGFTAPVIINDEVYFKAANDETAKWGRSRQGLVCTTILKDKFGRDKTLHDHFMVCMRHIVHSIQNADGSGPMYTITCKDEEDSAIDDLRYKMCYMIGFVEIIKGFDGVRRAIPKSLKFEECSEEDADRYREAAFQYLAQHMKTTVQALKSMGREYI